MLKYLGIFVVSLFLTVGSVHAEELPSIFNDAPVGETSYLYAVDELTEQDMKNIEGKWVWIPVVAGIFYCSHFYVDNNGTMYYHWTCW